MTKTTAFETLHIHLLHLSFPVCCCPYQQAQTSDWSRSSRGYHYQPTCK